MNLPTEFYWQITMVQTSIAKLISNDGISEIENFVEKFISIGNQMEFCRKSEITNGIPLVIGNLLVVI